MKKFLIKLKDVFKVSDMKAGDFLAAFFSAFVVASAVFAIGGDFTDLTYVRMYSLVAFVLSALAAFLLILLAVILFKTNKVVRAFFYCISVFFCVILAAQNTEDIFFNIGLAFILLLVVKYCVPLDKKSSFFKADISKKTSFISCAVLFILFTVVVFIFTLAKYRSYYHATFDFGIFAQMFEQMAKTGLPLTSVERQGVTSHFAVHFSPIFYLFLPGYYIFRSPLYLLFVQAAMVGLGIFPIRRIATSLGFSNRAGLIFGLTYLLFPTIANGTFFDFHENKFLTVLILYLVMFVLENKRVGVAIFAGLTLSVKEDAFIYVLAVALWMFFTKRDRIFALIMAVVSVGYFFFACQMIVVNDGEIMSTRFDNYSAESKKTLFSVMKTCLVNIGYLVKEVFSGADVNRFKEVTYTGQKMEFVLWTCIPLVGLPFLQKKSGNLLLLIPMLVINLMPYWLYQSDIDYQYTYGTVALLIFSAMLALSNISKEKHGFFIAAMLAISIVFTTSVVLPKAAYYSSEYLDDKQTYDATQEALDVIPKDASVTAYGYMMPHLWYIDELRTCPDYYDELSLTDYYVIDVRYKGDEHSQKMFQTMGDNYVLVASSGYADVYKLKNLVEE